MEVTLNVPLFFQHPSARMAGGLISEKDFRLAANQLIALSGKLGDGWRVVTDDRKVRNNRMTHNLIGETSATKVCL